MSFIDILGLLFIAVMVIYGFFLVFGTTIEKIKGSNYGKEVDWSEIFIILLIISCPVFILIFFS